MGCIQTVGDTLKTKACDRALGRLVQILQKKRPLRQVSSPGSPKISEDCALSTRLNFDSRVEAISSPYWERTRPWRVLGSATRVFLGKTMAAGRAATP